MGREKTEDFVSAIRLIMREEIQASEQRTNERFDKIDAHLDKVEAGSDAMNTPGSSTQQASKLTL